MKVVHHFFRVSEVGGGVPRAVFDLVSLGLASGQSPVLMSSADSVFPADWAAAGDNAPQRALLEEHSGPLGLLSRRGLARAAETLRSADVLHLHGLWRPRNSQLARLADRLGLPTVISVHGMLDDWSMSQGAWRKRVYYRAFERRNLARAGTVHLTAEAEKEQAGRWIPHDRIEVIPVAMDLEPYRRLPGAELFDQSRPEIDPEKPTILFLSRLHPKKRVELVIEALALLAAEGSGAQLLLAGEGEREYVEGLRAQARRLGLEERVIFLGMVVGAEKLSLYQRADVFALPTHQENFGLVLAESLACGTPVVTTRGTDIWPEVEASGGGRVVDTTAAAFAREIAALLEAPEVRERSGRAGREWVLDWLDPSRVMERYDRMYRALLPA